MPTHPNQLNRRTLLQGGVAAVAGAAVAGLACGAEPCSPAAERVITKGRIKQDAVRWCYEPMPLETLARHAAAMGLAGIEIVEPKEWPILKRHGLVCPMTQSHGFVEGLSHPENHASCLEKLRAAIDVTAAAGFPNVITFSGVRRGMPDDVGLEHTVAALSR